VLPPLGESPVLIRWRMQAGESFREGALIAELEADKALMEWRASEEGVLLARLLDEGAALESGVAVAIVGNPGDDANGATSGEELCLLYSRMGPAG
jgi:pyruvate dehydrogenase E2 component (dihydrolipoamide acetyltransferase)